MAFNTMCKYVSHDPCTHARAPQHNTTQVAYSPPHCPDSRGVCVDYFFLAREANAAGDCNCKPYAASETWARYKTREEYMCWKWPVDMYCETHGVCMGGMEWLHCHANRHAPCIVKITRNKTR